MDKIRLYFETITDLPDEDWEIFHSRLVRQEYPKKQSCWKPEKRRITFHLSSRA